MAEMFRTPEFPEEFRGIWERAFPSAYTNTLTFTSTTLKDSSQQNHGIVQGISGDVYTMKSQNGSVSFKITIKLKDGNLEIIDNEADSTTSGWQSTETDWTGTWKRR